MGTLKTIVKEHIEWKYQILKLAKADIIKTYSGAALGWFWAIIKPAVTIFVFWFAFSFGLRQSQDVSGVPYALWIISGMLPWFYMSEMITQGANSISQYRYLVTKMKYPVSTIPTFVGLSKLAVHICLFIIVVAIFCCFGFYPDKYMLQLPLYMYFMVQYFVVWGLFSALLSAVSKDFPQPCQSFRTGDILDVGYNVGSYEHTGTSGFTGRIRAAAVQSCHIYSYRLQECVHI